MTRNLVLFGMMGSGKTTVARAVAQRLEREVVDTDDQIERRTGTTIADIVTSSGEAALRAHERSAVARVTRRDDLVVSVGGGAVLDERNVERLRASGVLIELRAPVSVLAARLASDTQRATRPLLVAPDLVEAITSLATARRASYEAAADHAVDADAAVDDIADAVIAWASGEPGVLSAAELARVAG